MTLDDLAEAPDSLSPSDEPAESSLVEYLNSIARGDSADVATYFHEIGEPELLGGTKTTCRTHWLACDAMGRPRMNALAERLATHVIDYCIPREKIEEARAQFNKTKSPSSILRLESEAKSLFSSLAKSGEGGELLLYFLLETGLGIPQILCKMPLKTNTNLMINGVDGVHAKALENGNIAVYWGESKVYDDFAGAASECFSSIAPYLLDAGGGALRQDLLIARNNLDAGAREMSLKLARFFTEDAPESLKLEMRGACLVAFTHEDFSPPFDTDGSTVKAAVLAELKKWHSGVESRLAFRKIESFHIEFFCLPIPSSEQFRTAIAKSLGIN